LFDIELNPLAFFQVSVSVALDGGVMDENVLATLTLDKAVAFAAVKPFDRADDSFRNCNCLLRVNKIGCSGTRFVSSERAKQKAHGYTHEPLSSLPT
jgi:hypothetical protein